ncbi:outer membrane beta-barrel protein [Haliangium sp.]|uniref:outer membrane beta-barrel protein n=1 Tax=Haliangium sp. TaxID=2663208 RepID=UPI003D0B6084
MDNLWLGGEAGAGGATIVGEGTAEDISDYSDRLSIGVGGLARISFTRWLAARTGLSFTTMGTRTRLTTTGSTGETLLSYLELPATVEFSYFKVSVIEPYLSVGTGLGVNLGCRTTQGDDSGDCSRQTRAIDWTVSAGGGVAFNLPWNGRLTIAGHYRRSLISIDDLEPISDYKNRVVSFTIGYQHNLGDLVDRVRGKPRPDTAGPAEAAEPDQDSAEAPE